MVRCDRRINLLVYIIYLCICGVLAVRDTTNRCINGFLV
nr:MAG TPA: hypothetical protein [Caudoviricetes sp.]